MRIWVGVFAPESTDEAVEHLETVIIDMANDKLPAWFMHATQSAKFIALVKGEAQRTRAIANHRPVQILNTISKVGDKVMLQKFQADYIREMMPQQLGVGVKFAAELLVMGLRMIISLNKDFIIINVDIVNAYCEVMRASVIERHMEHDRLRGMVPYWRAKLGPAANLWTGDGSMEYREEHVFKTI